MCVIAVNAALLCLPVHVMSLASPWTEQLHALSHTTHMPRSAHGLMAGLIRLDVFKMSSGRSMMPLSLNHSAMPSVCVWPLPERFDSVISACLEVEAMRMPAS